MRLWILSYDYISKYKNTRVINISVGVAYTSRGRQRADSRVVSKICPGEFHIYVYILVYMYI